MITSFWTADRIDTLRTLHAQNMTFDEIGAKLGTTRLAVNRKANRLGLSKRMAGFAAEYRWRFNEKPKPIVSPFDRRTTPKPPQHYGVVLAPGSLPVPLIERTGCCYPTTDGKPFMFCNAATSRGDYCDFHRRRMFNHDH